MNIKTKLRTATALAVACSALFSVAAFDVKQLSPVHQALYGAMRSGYTIGAAGGTEADMQAVFLKIKAGDTNAVQDWLNAHSRR